MESIRGASAAVPHCFLNPPPLPVAGHCSIRKLSKLLALVNPNPVDAKEHVVAPAGGQFEPPSDGGVEYEIPAQIVTHFQCGKTGYVHGRRWKEQAAWLAVRACEHMHVINEPTEGRRVPLNCKHVVSQREVDGEVAV